MLTHFKSILITSENIEESHEQFHKLFGHDTSDICNDSDLKIYSHSLKMDLLSYAKIKIKKIFFIIRSWKNIIRIMVFKLYQLYLTIFLEIIKNLNK